MNVLHKKAVERDASVDHQLDRIAGRLNHHRGNANTHQTVIQEFGARIDQLEKDNEDLLERLKQVEYNACTCSHGPSLVGGGSESVPFELEYASSEYVTPPVTSSGPSPPSENDHPYTRYDAQVWLE